MCMLKKGDVCNSYTLSWYSSCPMSLLNDRLVSARLACSSVRARQPIPDDLGASFSSSGAVRVSSVARSLVALLGSRLGPGLVVLVQGLGLVKVTDRCVVAKRQHRNGSAHERRKAIEVKKHHI
jgi:hypothetical protein